MAVLRSAVDPASDEFATNASAMRRQVAELSSRTATLTEGGAGGDEPSIARHRERGKLPVRERVERLIDPGSAFLETSALAATGMYDDDAPGAGMVTGRISTRATTVMATGTQGSRSRVAEPSSSPPTAAPTTNAPTSTVTSRSVAERRRAPAIPGIAATIAG